MFENYTCEIGNSLNQSTNYQSALPIEPQMRCISKHTDAYLLDYGFRPGLDEPEAANKYSDYCFLTHTSKAFANTFIYFLHLCIAVNHNNGEPPRRPLRQEHAVYCKDPSGRLRCD